MIGPPDEDARACAKAHDVEVEEGANATKGHVLIAFFEAFVEDKLIQPTHYLRLSGGEFSPG